MSQDDIDTFVDSAFDGTLTPEGITAAVASGIPVNGRNRWGHTALHWAVRYQHRGLVAALLEAGANPNMEHKSGETSASVYGETSVWVGAAFSTAGILQLLMDGGGSVNEQDTQGQTPLIAVVLWNKGDAAVRLQMLLACLELDLDARSDGKIAEEWAATEGYPELVAAIAKERFRRVRWSAARCAWVSATARS
jgi:ankyrin repeat protein